MTDKQILIEYIFASSNSRLSLPNNGTELFAKRRGCIGMV